MALAQGTFRWSESDLREVEANYVEEISSQWMYSALADADRNSTRATLLRRLAEYEGRHAALWAGLLRRHDRPLPPEHRLANQRILVRLARWFGVGSVLSVVHREEVDGIEKYRDQQRRWQDPDAQRLFSELLPDEVVHEIETTASARDEGALAAGGLRSVLLGSIDGLASTVALAAGVAGATSSSHTIVIAGSAAVVAGALSMAASEYVSVKAEHDVVLAQARMEREALTVAPETKRRQLVASYTTKGLTPEEAEKVVARLTAEPGPFLRALLAERYGSPEAAEETPVRQGLYTGVSFALAGALTILPFLFLGAQPGVIVSVALAASALFIAGLLRSLSSLEPFLRGGLEMMAVGMGAAAGTFLIGLAIGGVVG
jgi:VIT1/CCC1 family predicted Fe2+/Mn2+ transporter/rubrerythrin